MFPPSPCADQPFRDGNRERLVRASGEQDMSLSAPRFGLTTRAPMTAAGVAGVQALASFVAMITLVPVLFLLAVLKVGRIAQFPSRAGCHNRLAEGTEFTDAQGRRRCARPFELAEHAGMTLRLAREKPTVRAWLARERTTSARTPCDRGRVRPYRGFLGCCGKFSPRMPCHCESSPKCPASADREGRRPLGIPPRLGSGQTIRPSRPLAGLARSSAPQG